MPWSQESPLHNRAHLSLLFLAADWQPWSQENLGCLLHSRVYAGIYHTWGNRLYHTVIINFYIPENSGTLLISVYNTDIQFLLTKYFMNLDIFWWQSSASPYLKQFDPDSLSYSELGNVSRNNLNLA